MKLGGIHHVSSVTANAVGNIDFYTNSLGLRLVKKTVNQDDVSSYHFYYGDEIGRPGTVVTFFDWRYAAKNRPGAGTISGIALSVDDQSIDWWVARLTDLGVQHSEIRLESDVPVIDFSDFEGQALKIVGQPTSGKPWRKSAVPDEFGILGVHHVTLTVHSIKSISRILVDILGMSKTGEFEGFDNRPVHIFEMGAGGAGGTVRVVETDSYSQIRLGSGGVHHVAFRTPNAAEQAQWIERIRSYGLQTSGLIDRFYFSSIYFREPGGILFEIATDGPGFTADEDFDRLGERLSLPPFLESRRAVIEAGLLPQTPK